MDWRDCYTMRPEPEHDNGSSHDTKQKAAITARLPSIRIESIAFSRTFYGGENPRRHGE
jgi:hypothetical protein